MMMVTTGAVNVGGVRWRQAMTGGGTVVQITTTKMCAACNSIHCALYNTRIIYYAWYMQDCCVHSVYEEEYNT